ncbi:hypothetical protein D9613_006040 [Agrocybe pediades]|uniref:Ubiquitin-like protease family profile domain-containing protein n=1 Tax=Agrocybe pediades TaxID=84607 RepID=A0A8H4QVV8_9AGAR|nr:hypothetical protein D9613_006040 [Agrocybe pediades]
MTSRSDRELISSLNFLTGSRHAPGSIEDRPASQGFKKPATIIATPTNKPLRGSGHNPFGANPNQNRRQGANEIVGNPTAHKTYLTGAAAASRNGERPAKRQRLSEPEPYSRGLASSSTSGRRKSGLPPLAPEHDIINVEDDDEIEDVGPLSPSSNTLARRPNPNPRPQFSKFFDNNKSQLNATTSKITNIAPDGPSTNWLKKNYEEEDAILSYSDPPLQPLDVGYVRQEAKKVDFIALSRQKGANRMKKKEMKINKIPLTDDPVILPNDPMTTPTNFSSNKKENRLPVKEAYVDEQHYPGPPNQELHLVWTDQNIIRFRVNQIEKLSLTTTKNYCKGVEHNVEKPVLYIKPLLAGLDSPTLAVKFDTQNSEWDEKKYKLMLKMLKDSLGPKSLSAHNGEILWESIRRSRKNDTGASNVLAKNEITRQQVPRAGDKRKSKDCTPSKSPPAEAIEPPGLSGAQPKRRAGQPPADNLRRSSRNLIPEKVPQIDSDEVILVYPQNAQGAVNVTNGDLARLQPGEFLNDTLIEFGLKLWLKELEESHPDLAKQIHIFSSFFYKKLNSKKDMVQAFASVRKWTSKFDVFQKKYIIVPINEHLHWYLAIICEPEHILLPPADPAPKKQTRSSVKPPVADAEEADPNTFGEQEDTNITPSEAEVEQNLNMDFESSCNIGDHNKDPAVPLNEGAENMSNVSDLSYLTDESAPPKTSSRPHSVSPIPVTPERNEPSSIPPSSRVSEDMVVDDSTEELDSKPAGSTPAIPPKRFYGSAKNKGKERAIPDSNTATPTSRGGDVEVYETPKTYIFILDSLGTRHPQACKKLAKYLEMEAADKKGIEKFNSALGKSAFVPVQPNFCDCGVYLLHFARIFMNEPLKYCQSILSQKSKPPPNKEKQEVWQDHQVAEMREEIANRIRALSKTWKEGRVIKKDAEPSNQVVISDSDDDIDILDSTSPKKNQGPANRPRG